ncbi:hypothetical protein ACLOJK_019776 [Asimina triloba]
MRTSPILLPQLCSLLPTLPPASQLLHHYSASQPSPLSQLAACPFIGPLIWAWEKMLLTIRIELLLLPNFATGSGRKNGVVGIGEDDAVSGYSFYSARRSSRVGSSILGLLSPEERRCMAENEEEDGATAAAML